MRDPDSHPGRIIGDLASRKSPRAGWFPPDPSPLHPHPFASLPRTHVILLAGVALPSLLLGLRGSTAIGMAARDAGANAPQLLLDVGP